MAYPCLFGDLYLDSVTRRNHIAPKTMTTHPIEDGSLLAEHITDQAETLTLDVVLTDDDLVYYGEMDAEVRARQLVTSKDAKKQHLKALKAKEEIIDIVFDDEVFSGFVLLDIMADETARNALAYEATLICERVRTYDTLDMRVPLPKIRAKKVQAKTDPATKGEPTADKGEVTPEKPADQETTKAIIAGLVDLLQGAP